VVIVKTIADTSFDDHDQETVAAFSGISHAAPGD
jgi:hypothetical protein